MTALIRALGVLLAIGLVAAAAGCGGGGGDGAAATPTEAPAAQNGTDVPTEETTADTTGASAPAAGKGVLALDDGRWYAIAIGECTFQPSGTIEVSGTSDEGSTFTMTQFVLGGEWSQTDASIELANGDRIYVIVSSATPNGEPAEVEGKAIAWEQVFQELDESANSVVYSGNGTLRLSCP